MFRSETMHYYSVLFSQENAWEILNELGHLGIIDIQDLHKEDLEIKKPFYSQLSEIDRVLE